MPTDSNALLHDPAPAHSAGLSPYATGFAAAARVAATTAPVDDWSRVLGAVRRRKWLVAAVALVGTAAGVVGARFLPPRYQTRAIIWVEVPDRTAVPNRGPIEGGQLLGGSSGWLEVLRSDVVLEDVVRTQRLFLGPARVRDALAFATFGLKDVVRPGRYRLELDPTGQNFMLLDAEAGVPLERGVVGDSIGSDFGFAWAPSPGMLAAGSRMAFNVTSPGEATLRLADELNVKQSDDRRFVTVEWRAANPELAVRTVNGIVERLVSVAADLKRQRLAELTNILADQLEQARHGLANAEAALTAFRVRHATVPATSLGPGAAGTGGAPDPRFGNYVELRLATSQLAHDREAIEDALAQAGDSGVSADALASIASVQRSPDLSDALKELTAKQAELRALRFRYTDTHPPVQQLAAEIDTLQRRIIPRLAKSLAAALSVRLRDADQRADAVSRELQGAPPVAREETRLVRDQMNAVQLFSDVQQRYDEARLAEVSSLPDLRVLQHAVRPGKPITNLRPLLVVLAFFGSLGLGAVGATVLDAVDPKVRDADHVSRTMGLSVLGALPHLRHNGRPHDPGDDAAQVIEALRGLRLNVQHAHGTAGPLVVTVTSPGRGDGKSFITANLARTFATVGARTLVIDGDVRLGSLHHALGVARSPGLSDVLAGRASIERAVQATTNPLLFAIGCGSRMGRAPELLSTPALPRVLAALRSVYDVILVDSAPLTAGVDPYALGTATGNVMVVLRTGVTQRAMAAAKVEALQRLPIRLLGAVLNDVRQGSTYGYYAYSLAHYEGRAEDEDLDETARLVLPSKT